MGHHKIGLIIPHPEDQKWDSVWKLFRTPNLNLTTLAALIPEDEYRDWETDRKSTRLNSSHEIPSRMPSSA